MSVRRTHTKSRKGCLECKQKHYKYNEVHPECGNCERLGIRCSFSGLTSHVASPYFRAPTSDACTQTDPQHDLYGEALAISDLEILHNFHKTTISSLFADEEASRIWKTEFMDLEFVHHYVLNTMMAFSALHLYYQERSRLDVYTRATFLQGIALRQAQPHIAHLTQEHSLPLFAFTSITTMYSLAESTLHPRRSQLDPLENLVRYLRLGRGILVALQPHWDHLKSTWLKPLLEVGHVEKDMFPSIERDFPAYGALRDLALECRNETRRSSCLHAVERLFLYMAAFKDATSMMPSRLIQSWAVELQEPVIEMLSEHHPLALIIFAHYAIMQNMVEGAWWLQGWLKWILECIEQTLDEPWKHYLVWPKQMVFGDLERQGAAL